LDVLVAKVTRIDPRWNRIIVGKLLTDNLLEEVVWESDDYRVRERVTIIDLHIARNAIDITQVLQLDLELDLIPQEHRWQFIVVLGRGQVLILDQLAYLLLLLDVGECVHERCQLFQASFAELSMLDQLVGLDLDAVSICLLLG
jgi:hypothetical protein